MSVKECLPTLALPVQKPPDAPKLLGLPAKLRAAIIFEVLASVDKNPVLSSETIPNRIRLEQHCDIHNKDCKSEMNIYLPRRPLPVPNSADLLSTCRKLRENTEAVIEDIIEHMRENSGKAFVNSSKAVEFVLDVMFVKDVGLVPTWLSFPFRSDHVERLRVQIRAIQPSAGLIHPAFMQNTRYCDGVDAAKTVTDSPLFAVLDFYAFNRLLLSKINARPCKLSEEKRLDEIRCKKWNKVHQELCQSIHGESCETFDYKNFKLLQDDMYKGDHVDGCKIFREAEPKIEFFDTNIREIPPYSVGKILIDVHREEYTPDGDALVKGSSDEGESDIKGDLRHLFLDCPDTQAALKDVSNRYVAFFYISMRLEMLLGETKVGEPPSSERNLLYTSLMPNTGVVKIRGPNDNFTWLVNYAARDRYTAQMNAEPEGLESKQSRNRKQSRLHWLQYGRRRMQGWA